MADVKQIIVKVIPSNIANEFVKKHHYSWKVVSNSQLHFGCFLNGVLGGGAFLLTKHRQEQIDLTCWMNATKWIHWIEQNGVQWYIAEKFRIKVHCNIDKTYQEKRTTYQTNCQLRRLMSVLRLNDIQSKLIWIELNQTKQNNHRNARRKHNRLIESWFAVVNGESKIW